MNFAKLSAWWSARSRWEQAALIVWAGILLFVSVRVFFWPKAKTVYPIYSVSHLFWWDGTDLYEPYRPADVPGGFRYAPTFALMMAPFAFFPDSVGGILWRLAGAGALLGSLWWCLRVLPGAPTSRHTGWLFLLLVPLSMQSLNNGQANIHVAACMLATIACVFERRWTLAAVAIALAVVCKIYPLSLGLVLIVLYPRELSWRIPLAVAAAMLVPFLFQHPDYVVDQYRKWIENLRTEDRTNIPLEHMYRDLWLLFHLYGIPVGRTAYVLIQVGAGAAIAALCWYRQRSGWSEQTLLTSTLALVAAWMMLLGPSTESSSFALLAPSLAWSIVEAIRERPWRVRSLLLWGACAFFLAAVSLSSFARTVRISELGVHSWGSLLYFVYLLAEPRPPQAAVAAAPATPPPLPLAA